ncbi:unnamed protein product [Discula destructiva]
MARKQNGLKSLAVVAAVALPCVDAAFSTASGSNIAVYWGQNSYGQTGSQERLSYYCSNTEIDIIPLAFMDTVSTPIVNFANAGDNCTTFSGTQLLDCPQLEVDIVECQSTYGKTIMLSIGGATYTEGGFASAADAIAAAQNVWALFGPETPSSSSVDRPFGTAVVDGFDFDFESTTQNMAAFGQELRSLMDDATAAGDKAYYLSAAPQCPYPDAADNEMLDGAVSFDWIQVQFYNNYCGVNSFVSGQAAQWNFNFDTWDAWASTTSANPDVKILLGIPANVGAAGSGYTAGSTLAAAIQYSKTFDSFGGVMMWDMSQLYENAGYLDEIVSDLGSPAGSDPSLTTTATTTSTTTATTLSTSTTAAGGTTTTLTAPAATGTGVAQWGQCGGIGYTGSTVCASPYTCVYLSKWWAQCD